MKLTNVIKIWNTLQQLELGELRFDDLENVVREVVGVKDNLPPDTFLYFNPEETIIIRKNYDTSLPSC